MGLPHMGLTKIYKSGYGPDEPAKKNLNERRQDHKNRSVIIKWGQVIMEVLYF